MDLARAERLAGGAQLVAGREHLNPRAPVDGQFDRAGGDGRPELSRPEGGSGSEDGVAGAHVLPGVADVVAFGHRGVREDRAVTDLDVLLGDHRGGAVGDRPAGRDPDRTAVREGVRRGRSGP